MLEDASLAERQRESSGDKTHSQADIWDRGCLSSQKSLAVIRHTCLNMKTNQLCNRREGRKGKAKERWLSLSENRVAADWLLVISVHDAVKSIPFFSVIMSFFTKAFRPVVGLGLFNSRNYELIAGCRACVR